MGTLDDVFIVARSSNSKLGNLPATYRPASTCPTSCAFLPANQGGCYGSGRIFGLASKRAGTITEAQLDATLAKAERGAKYMRDRVVGDLVTPDGRFDLTYVQTIARAARKAGLQVFGYTHAQALMTRQTVRAVEKTGYLLNASCENRKDIETAVALGLPTVVTGNSWVEGEVIAGRRIVTCLAQTHGLTCADCGLCAKERACTVRFKLHGPTRMAAASIQRRLEEDA